MQTLNKAMSDGCLDYSTYRQSNFGKALAFCKIHGDKGHYRHAKIVALLGQLDATADATDIVYLMMAVLALPIAKFCNGSREKIFIKITASMEKGAKNPVFDETAWNSILEKRAGAYTSTGGAVPGQVVTTGGLTESREFTSLLYRHLQATETTKPDAEETIKIMAIVNLLEDGSILSIYDDRAHPLLKSGFDHIFADSAAFSAPEA